MKIMPTHETLGANVEDIDLSQPLGRSEFGAILRALGEHGALCFPRQSLDTHQLKVFSEHFGGLQASLTGTYCEPGMPEVMILSNVVEDGKPLGLADAGQDWHTDMSYNELIGFTNVLYGIKIPRRDGRALGNTVFANMHAAYDGLPDELKQRLRGMTATHDFNKFWEEMRRRPGSTRPPLTPEQRAQRPPAVHPVFRPTRSPGAKSCTVTPATWSASTNSTRRRAAGCWPTCSSTNCARSSSTPTTGRRATC